MNELDKLFKNKLGNREFEFKENYWQQAEQMIVADQAGRNWKKGFWLFGMLLLVALAGLVFWPKQEQVVENKTPGTSSLEIPAGLNQDSDRSTDESGVVVKENLLSSENADERSGSFDQSNNNAANEKSREKTPGPTEGTDHFETAVRDQSLNKTPPPSIDEHVIDEAGILMTTESLNLANESSEETENETSRKENLLTENQDRPGKTEKKTETGITENPALTGIEPIVPVDLKVEEVSRQRVGDYPVIRSKTTRFNIGFTLAGVFYPEKTDGTYWSGLRTGIVTRYPFSKALSVHADLLYSRLKNGPLEVSSTQSQYGFGLETIEYRLRSKHYHFAELPLYLQWRTGRNAVEGGFSLSFLTGIRGEMQSEESLFPWERNGLQSKIENLGKAWLSTEAFNRFNSSMMLGYRYLLDRQFSVGFRTSYRLNNLLKNKVDSDFILTEPSKLQVELSATWLMF